MDGLTQYLAVVPASVVDSTFHEQDGVFLDHRAELICGVGKHHHLGGAGEILELEEDHLPASLRHLALDAVYYTTHRHLIPIFKPF